MSNVPPPPGANPPPPPGGGFPAPPPPPGGGFPAPAPPPTGGGGFGGFGGQPANPQGAFAPPGYSSGAQRAGFGSRLGSFIIDGLIVATFNLPAYIVLQVGPTKLGDCPDSVSTNPLDICEVPTSGTWTVAVLLWIVAFVAGVAYWAILVGKGATVGQKALGLRVQDITTGQAIGTGRGVGRYFGMIVSAIPCYLGFFWMLWDDQSQTWHDKMVSSVVVRNP